MSKDESAKQDLRTRFWVEVIADNVIQHPDLQLQMIIRQAVIQYSQFDLTLDEALSALEREVVYLNTQIRKSQK